MTTIPFRPSITSMLITVINALIELAFLSALFISIALYECHRLRNGKLVHIKRHCIFVRVLAILAMTIFIILEISISTNSRTVFRNQVNVEPCLRSFISTNSSDDSATSSAILFQCMKVENKTFLFRGGNYSLKTGRVQCEPEILYKYDTDDWIENVPIGKGVINCKQGLCLMIKAKGKILLISRDFEEGSEKVGKNTSFLRTTLSFNPSRSLGKFGEKTLGLMDKYVTDELLIRRHILLGAKNGSCTFSQKKEEITEISTWMFILILCIWVGSFMVFIAMFISRRNVFYDMSSTLDWATKTHQMVDDIGEGDLHVKCVMQDGERRMFVVKGQKGIEIDRFT